jgi:hypothetical protein
MEPLAVYIFDHSEGYQDVLEQQLDKKGVQRLPVQIPVFTWRNRALKTMEIAREYPDRVLFFLDAWDTLFLGSKAELENPTWADGVTFAAQKRCWPDPVEMQWNVWWEGRPSTRWRYVNSNPMVGLGSSVTRALEWGWARFPLQGGVNTTTDPSGEVCERFYTQLICRAPNEFKLRLDTGCILSQIMSEGAPGEVAVGGGRLINCVTQTRPIFMHLNAKLRFDLSLLDG